MKKESCSRTKPQDCIVGDPLVWKLSGQILRHNEEIKKAGETALLVKRLVCIHENLSALAKDVLHSVTL